MSLEELQEKAAALTREDRQKLAAFLTVLRMKDSGEWDRAFMSDEGDGSGWISLQEARRRLLPRKE